MLFFSKRGYPCYAVSYRGHGKSWYPGFWQMYFTSRGAIGKDLVAGMEEAERMEGERRNSEERIRMVLISHSAGGALSQYVMSRGLVKAQGFCMFAAVPGFGSYVQSFFGKIQRGNMLTFGERWSCYKFWLLTAPIHFYYRFFHSRYLLATTKQVHDAFFSPSTPTSTIKELEGLLSPYESMCWPMQALSPFVTGPDVVQQIIGWTSREGESTKEALACITPRFLVLAAEQDVLCTPPVLLDAAKRYRAAFRLCLRTGRLDGVSEEDVESVVEDGVAFMEVKGVAHHLQNHVEWEKGAKAVLQWAEKL
jgi:pimeloyl-ACP methyl ester carboxylesterase